MFYDVAYRSSTPIPNTKKSTITLSAIRFRIILENSKDPICSLPYLYSDSFYKNNSIFINNFLGDMISL
jgi:hypothetical protein